LGIFFLHFEFDIHRLYF
jgi:hypothetical protein